MNPMLALFVYWEISKKMFFFATGSSGSGLIKFWQEMLGILYAYSWLSLTKLWVKDFFFYQV
jgi:hypothetical protein